METPSKTKITVEAEVRAPLEKVWMLWNSPEHITQWATASDDWHTPFAENDLRTGGKFKSTMAAKDGSMSFDFEGVYTNVHPHNTIEYVIADGRNVKVTFSERADFTTVTEVFEAEDTHPLDFQQQGWQSILDSFKQYTERN